jgi:hypothetical protein
MKKIYLLIVGLMLCIISQAQVISQYNDTTMHGGKIQDYAQNATCVLIATDGGIFKTINNGQSWVNVSQTFDADAVSCKKIVSIGTDFYAISNGNTGSYLYKSSNNGSLWTALTPSNWGLNSIGKLSNTLYALGSNMSSGYLYSSTDGSNWVQKATIWNNTGQNGNSELLSFNQSKLYIIANNELYFTSDGNTIDTIHATGLGSSGLNTNDDKIDGDALGNLYYRGDTAIYKYNFTSKLWSTISSGKITNGYQIMDLSVTDNNLFVVAMNTSLGIKLYNSTNQGNTFNELTSTGLFFPMIGNIIEVSATNFIGNSLDDRILISSNGGTSWTMPNTQYVAAYTGNLTRSGNSLLFSREVRGLVRSTNSGTSWANANNGVPGFGGIAYFINDIIQAKDTLFSFCQFDPFGNSVSLFKSSDNGTSWTASPIPSPYTNGDEYWFAGSCDSALFVNYIDLSDFSYPLIVSFNNGTSWTKPSSTNSSTPIYLKGPKNCLFACYAPAFNNWDDFSNIWKTTNFGGSFTDINTGNMFNNNVLIKRLLANRGDKGSMMMDYDATNNMAIFVVRDRTMGSGTDKLFTYNISTNTWTEITTSGLTLGYVANCIKYTGSYWLLATSTGLYKSTNNGVNWTMVHTQASWQNGIIVNSIQIIGNKVFLGTIANGVWYITLSSGVLEQLTDDEIQVFPNPSTDFINIKLPDLKGKSAVISLYDIEGKEIFVNTVNNAQSRIDLSKLPVSSYFIVIEANNKLYRKTIIRN